MSILRGGLRLGTRLARLGIASVAGVVLVAGVPYLLVRFVGNPVPNAVPAWDEVMLSLRSRELDDSFFVGVLAIIVWAAWAQLLLSLAVEIKAAARGARSSAVRGLGATQWLARRLVAQFTLASTLLVQTSVGVTLPAAPALADVVPAHVIIGDDDGDGETGEPAPEPSDGMVLEVEASDTLWDLAETHLGDGARWMDIRDANVGRTMADGTVLKPGFVTISGGWSLRIPTDDRPAPGLGHPASEEVIGAWRVQPGDHFWAMAETVLSEGWGRTPNEDETRAYWLDIIGHNRANLISPGNDPNLIYADQSFEILLPPLPPDGLSPSDDLATTTPRPLTDIPQFEPVHRVPPPTHRNGTEPGGPVDPDAIPDDDPTGDGAGPVVELAQPGSEEAGPAASAEAATGDGPDASPSEHEPTASPAPGSLWSTLAVAGVGLTGVGAAVFLNSLRARRRYQAARRRPGSIPDLPDDDHHGFETRVRSIADHEALRWLEATNKFLTHTLDSSDTWRLPPVVAMRAGEHGVEVLLDEDLTPPQGFISGEQPRSWVVDPDIEVRQLEAEADQRLPYAPLLLPVGGTGGGDLLVEFGQLGAVGLEGPSEAIIGWLRSVTVAVATSSWSHDVRVVAIGVDPILARMPNVEVPGDPVAWTVAELDEHRSHEPRDTSRYEQRLGGHPVPETLVLIGPGHEGVAQHLVELGEEVDTPFTVLAAAPLRGHARVHFDGDKATLEPTGLTFWPSVMSAEAIMMSTTLLDQSTDTGSVPADVSYADEVPGVGVDSHTTAAWPERVDLFTAAPGDPDPVNGIDSPDGAAGQPVAPVPPADSSPRRPTGEPAAEYTERPTPAALGPDNEPEGTPPGGQDETDDDDSTSSEVTPVSEEGPTVPPAGGGGVNPTEGRSTAKASRPPSGAVVDGRRSATTTVTGSDFEQQTLDQDMSVDLEPDRPDHAPDQSSTAALAPSVPDDESNGAEHHDLVTQSETHPSAPGPSRAAIAADQRVAEVLAARPIEVEVLTTVPGVVGTQERLTPKNASVVAFLAFHRSVTSTALRDAFWPASVNRSTSDNAISTIRRVLGTTAEGEPRLHLATEGRFAVSEEIGCDWTRFQMLVDDAAAARNAGAFADEIVFLYAALGLVEGPIASGVEVKNWLWLRDDPLVYSRVETAIVDAAHRLGYLGCERGEPDLARWAADKGLSVVPEQEALYRIQMSAASLAGDDSTVLSVFRQAQRSAQPNGDGVQPETELLYRRLVGLGQTRTRLEGGSG